MKIVHRPTSDEVRRERQRRYLEAWPVERQMEAHAEAAQGRPGKLQAMLADFQTIRESLPIPDRHEQP